jgi:hypothetical protein
MSHFELDKNITNFNPFASFIIRVNMNVVVPLGVNIKQIDKISYIDFLAALPHKLLNPFYIDDMMRDFLK